VIDTHVNEAGKFMPEIDEILFSARFRYLRNSVRCVNAFQCNLPLEIHEALEGEDDSHFKDVGNSTSTMDASSFWPRSRNLRGRKMCVNAHATGPNVMAAELGRAHDDTHSNEIPSNHIPSLSWLSVGGRMTNHLNEAENVGGSDVRPLLWIFRSLRGGVSTHSPAATLAADRGRSLWDMQAFGRYNHRGVCLQDLCWGEGDAYFSEAGNVTPASDEISLLPRFRTLRGNQWQ
jgi:hypothetical protein